MTNIVRKVWKILDNSPCMRMDISRGVINSRALAKYIIKEKKLDATVDAVISAIRRYNSDHHEKIFENAYKVMVQSITITTKNPLVNIALTKDTEIQKLLPKLFAVINYEHGDVLRIIQADQSIKILVDEKNLEKVKPLFPENKIIKIYRNLAEINVHMHPDAKYTPGILAITSNELAINGINVLETMTCISELLWFVEEKDLLKAYNALNRLWQLNQKLFYEDAQDTSRFQDLPKENGIKKEG